MYTVTAYAICKTYIEKKRSLCVDIENHLKLLYLVIRHYMYKRRLNL